MYAYVLYVKSGKGLLVLINKKEIERFSSDEEGIFSQRRRTRVRQDEKNALFAEINARKCLAVLAEV